MSPTGGGTGFIGTALANSLRRRGYEVVLVSRKPGLYRLSWVGLTSAAAVTISGSFQHSLPHCFAIAVGGYLTDEL